MNIPNIPHDVILAILGGLFTLLQGVILKRQNEIHILVNSNMSRALGEISTLKASLLEAKNKLDFEAKRKSELEQELSKLDLEAKIKITQLTEVGERAQQNHNQIQQMLSQAPTPPTPKD